MHAVTVLFVDDADVVVEGEKTKSNIQKIFKMHNKYLRKKLKKLIKYFARRILINEKL